VGKPGAGGRTERLLGHLGIAERVRFVSGVSTGQLVAHYAEATLAVVPSLYEGFGLPAGEAMACAVPVVSTDGGALPEVVGEAGVLVPAGQVEALAQAIAGLLEDPARRAQLGAAGRARIVERFSWEVCAREVSRYYERVLAGADG
ncbi:MAG: glycosyltransferase, partial [Parahaliea sp.]